LIINGRGISPGVAKGKIALCDDYVSPLGEMGKDGRIKSGKCEDLEFKGKIFSFRGGRGSTVGSYVLLELKENLTSPIGIINEKAELVVLTGAIISGIPMIDGIPLNILKNDDDAIIDGKSGRLELLNVTQKDVSTVYLFHGDRLLVLHRSDKVSSYQNQFSAISGHIEVGETPEEAGRREVLEETGIQDIEIEKTGKPFPVRWENIVYMVHPILARTKSDKVNLNWENQEFRWIHIDELGKLNTVPRLKEALEELMKL